MEREDGFLLLHTNTFLLFLCTLCLNFNRPTCPSSGFFNTSSSHSLHFCLSLLCLYSAPSLHICTQNTEQSPQNTITLSLYCFIYSITYLSRSLSSHIIVYSVCSLCVYVCVCGSNTPRGTILH